MSRRFFAVLLIVWSLVLPGAASAADDGILLILSNRAYDRLRPASGAEAVLPVARRFELAGFDADQATDLAAAPMRAALDGLAERIRRERPARVVIVFAGYTLHSDTGGVWLMGTETQSPTLFNVDATGVRLETLLAIAGQIQGGAIVAIADLGYPSRPGTGLLPGLPSALNVPQGVSLIRGPASQLAGVLGNLAQPGTNLSEAVSQTRQVQLDGFTPAFLTFLPAGHAPTQNADRRAFAEAQEEDTIDAWRAYLAAFPQGLFADQARTALERLENTPELIEQRLGLTRDERRAIQRHLALLGFDPRGIDGIFGAGTRTAITGWQRREGLAATGFLDRDQIFRLAAQAARRAAELEEEERQRQAEAERRDRAFWRDTGAGRDEAGLRAYLQRYPRGLFAAIARERLAEIEAARAAEARARDEAAWEMARTGDSIASYRAYLAEYPRGLYARQAAERLQYLENPPPIELEPQIEADPVNEERALGLQRLTRLLIEQRLTFMGYNPGRIDGDFDNNARRAIRRFQADYGLAETGYINGDTLNLLLPDGLMQIIE